MENLLTHLDANTIIIAIVAVVLGIQQWRTGSSRVYRDALEAYKAQLDIMEKRLVGQTETINDQAGQIGELRGLLAGKEKQITDYKVMLENRDPQLQNILTEVVRFMKQLDTRFETIEGHMKKPFVAKTETTVTKN